MPEECAIKIQVEFTDEKQEKEKKQGKEKLNRAQGLHRKGKKMVSMSLHAGCY